MPLINSATKSYQKMFARYEVKKLFKQNKCKWHSGKRVSLMFDGCLSDTSSNPIKCSRCFIERDTYPHSSVLVVSRIEIGV